MTFGERIKDSDRKNRLIAEMFDYGALIWCGTATGSGNDYDLTPDISINSYFDGQKFLFLADKTNSGAATASVSGLATKDVVKTDASGAVAASDITDGKPCVIMYLSAIDDFLLVSNGV